MRYAQCCDRTHSSILSETCPWCGATVIHGKAFGQAVAAEQRAIIAPLRARGASASFCDGYVVSLSIGERINPISAGEFALVAGLTRLETLFIASDTLTDEALRHCMHLTSLNVLTLGGRGFTDGVFHYLAQIPSLRIVDLRLANVTAAAANEFLRGRAVHVMLLRD